MLFRSLKKTFNNSLIIIDEVHNIRNSDEKNKLVANAITKVVENADNLRLLLLSATPMFNNYKEIIWLINLMNKNDRRPSIQIKDVFNSDGSFKVDKNGKEIGKELLIRKATGYISFVRGENPYTFPYRIWASEFDKPNTFLYSGDDAERNELGIRMDDIRMDDDVVEEEKKMVEYDNLGRSVPDIGRAVPDIGRDIRMPPTIQMNNERIPKSDQLKMLPIYLVELGEYQQKAYDYIVKTYLKQQDEKKERKLKTRQQSQQSIGQAQHTEGTDATNRNTY